MSDTIAKIWEYLEDMEEEITIHSIEDKETEDE